MESTEIVQQLAQRMNNPPIVLLWYDFLCPFCYVAQHRNAILLKRGLQVEELPFQAHPEIPAGGISAGLRTGPMYATLEREAKEAGLQLRWPRHLPNTRRALAAAEWARRHELGAFPRLHKALFEAHFVAGEDLGDPAVVDWHASDCGVDVAAWHAAFRDGSALKAVGDAETLGHERGVQGTPAWFLAEQLILGLRPAADFERLAKQVLQSPG